MPRGKKKEKFIYRGRNKFLRLPNPPGVPVPMCLCGDPCKMERDSDIEEEETYMHRYWMCPNWEYEPHEKQRRSGYLTPDPLCEFHQWIDLEVSEKNKERIASHKEFEAKFKEGVDARRRAVAAQKEHREEEERRRQVALREERERKLERARRARAAMEENPDAQSKGKWPRCT